MSRRDRQVEERHTGGTFAAGSDASELPRGERLRRPSWRDPRLLVGLLIVLASVAGVVALLSSQDRTAPVYAADRSLAVGERLEAEGLRVVEVRIEELSEHYLSAAEELPTGMQIVSVVEEGELVPVRAVAEEDPQGRQAVTLEVGHAVASGVEPGRQVDVWAAPGPSLADGQEPEADRLVSAAEVSGIEESTSAFGAQDGLSLELLVSPEELPRLLAARSSGMVLSAVPAAEAETPAAEG